MTSTMWQQFHPWKLLALWALCCCWTGQHGAIASSLSNTDETTPTTRIRTRSTTPDFTERELWIFSSPLHSKEKSQKMWGMKKSDKKKDKKRGIWRTGGDAPKMMMTKTTMHNGMWNGMESRWENMETKKGTNHDLKMSMMWNKFSGGDRTVGNNGAMKAIWGNKKYTPNKERSQSKMTKAFKWRGMEKSESGTKKKGHNSMNQMFNSWSSYNKKNTVGDKKKGMEWGPRADQMNMMAMKSDYTMKGTKVLWSPSGGKKQPKASKENFKKDVKKGFWGMKSFTKGGSVPKQGKGKGKGKGKVVKTSSPTRVKTASPTRFATASPTGFNTSPPTDRPTSSPSTMPTRSHSPSTTFSPSSIPSSTGTPTTTAQPTPSSSIATIRPTINGEADDAFRSRDQLISVIDMYLIDNNPNSTVVQAFGPIQDWNVSLLSNFSNLFSATRNPTAAFFNESLENWDTSNAETMSRIFEGAELFNGNIGSWNVSKVKDFTGAFLGASSFNQDLSSWDTSSATTMEDMFRKTIFFDQNLSSWNVRQVQLFDRMFEEALSFNQDLDSWNTESAVSLEAMFRGAISFAGDISTWNVENVFDFGSMFEGSAAFNGDISAWQVTSGINFESMFEGTILFNQDLSSWNLTNASYLQDMFRMAFFFSQDLCPWAASLQTGDRVVNLSNMFDGTACEDTSDPDLDRDPVLTFCAICGSLAPSISDLPPSPQPSFVISQFPTFTSNFSFTPSEISSVSKIPSVAPSQTDKTPSISAFPSLPPFLSTMPSESPSRASESPSISLETSPPTSISMTMAPSEFPSSEPSTSLSNPPSEFLATPGIEFEQVGSLAGFDHLELFGVSLSASGNGRFFLVGAYSHSSVVDGGGRIELIDLEDESGEVIEALGTAENDAYGFSVSMSDDANVIAALRTSTGVLDILARDMTVQQEIQPALLSSTSVFQVSGDGNWLVIAGDEFVSDSEVLLKAKIYQFDMTTSRFEQFGEDIDIRSSAQSSTYSIDMANDGSVVVVGSTDTFGSFWVFERDGNGYSPLGDRIDSEVEDDGFGQSVEIAVTDADDLIVAVGIPFDGRVAVFVFNGITWVVDVEIEADAVYNFDSDFGYDVSLNQNGSLLLVGARCFVVGSENGGSDDGCDGAAQVFQLSRGNAASLGGIIAGPAFSFFGEAVAFSADGSSFAVGAPEDCVEADVCPGAVYFFQAQQ